MHPRRRPPIWSRPTVRVPILLAPCVIVFTMAMVSREAPQRAAQVALSPELAGRAALDAPSVQRRQPTRSGDVVGSKSPNDPRPGSGAGESSDPLEMRYGTWAVEAMAVEAERLSRLIDEHALARVGDLLETSAAEPDRGEAGDGVWIHGQGRRYRLDPEVHADLYAWKQEADWLKARADRAGRAADPRPEPVNSESEPASSSGPDGSNP